MNLKDFFAANFSLGAFLVALKRIKEFSLKLALQKKSERCTHPEGKRISSEKGKTLLVKQASRKKWKLFASLIFYTHLPHVQHIMKIDCGFNDVHLRAKRFCIKRPVYSSAAIIINDCCWTHLERKRGEINTYTAVHLNCSFCDIQIYVIQVCKSAATIGAVQLLPV